MQCKLYVTGAYLGIYNELFQGIFFSEQPWMIVSEKDIIIDSLRGNSLDRLINKISLNAGNKMDAMWPEPIAYWRLTLIELF